jgi:hypothetical protein
LRDNRCYFLVLLPISWPVCYEALEQ